MKRSTHSVCRKTASGFTLIEVLVAVAMALLLMTAVYSAIDMHWRYESAGQMELQRGQVARAVYAQLSMDIRSVQFAAPDPEEAAELEDDEAATEDEDGEDLADIDADDLLQTQSLGVFGTSTRLTLHVNKPVPPRLFSRVGGDDEENDLVLMESEQRSVTWFLADLGGGDLEGQAAARFVDDPAMIAAGLVDNDSALDGPLGLARSEVDRLSGDIDAPAETDSTLADVAEFLAPEIDSLVFRYFDGVDWQDEWDSEALGAIPTAIEITIGFVPPSPDDILQATASDAIPTSYRFVVALPVADAMISEEDL
ncbi:MAG: prepilin-type N-terminal cleavage/methylation domain-containing protein [Planctomycetota bacterium]|nr:prepilin-type N-terminal cleavage/methylation domain-containing protein [Planctomycetota bacterium]